MKLFTSDWDLKLRAKTWTHKKPSLELKPKRLGLKLGQNSAWDLNPRNWNSNPAHDLPTEITDLVSEPDIVQVLDGSSQK